MVHVLRDLESQPLGNDSGIEPSSVGWIGAAWNCLPWLRRVASAS